jgi:hypothetical protein
MERDQLAVYRDHLDLLQFYRKCCAEMMESAQILSKVKTELKQDYELVESKSQNLQDACERLLQDEVGF